MHPLLLKAARAGHGFIVGHLADEDRSRAPMEGGENRVLFGTTPEKNTALHIAAKLGHDGFASKLLDKEPSLVLQQNSRGDSPLHCAARAGHVPLVSLFLKSPVNREVLVGLKNRWQNTALHEAVLNDRVEVVEKLVECPALASMVNEAGASALYLAAERTSSDMVNLLLECPHDSSHAGPNGQTALHAAVLRSHEITELILSKRPHLLQEADAAGSTPLHFAASNGDLNIVELLLKRDPSVAYLKDKDGLSAIHIAASLGHLDLIKLFVEQSPESTELIDNEGRNLLHAAIKSKRLDVVKYVLRTPELSDLVNEPDYEGNTPLHLATINRSVQIVQILLGDIRAKRDVMNNKCLTPLDHATMNTERGVALRMYNIMVELVAAGSRFSPRRIDEVLTRLQMNSEEESNRYRTLANNLAIVAVLIATVTFAAAFTLPGGYRNDPGPAQGTAVLTRKGAFRVFLISDAGAMVSAIVAAFALIYTGSQDHDVRLHWLRIAMRLMWIALSCMVAAFATGTYVAVAPDCLWLGVVICLIACSAPLLLWLATYWPTFSSPTKRLAAKKEDPRNGSRVAAVENVGCSPLLPWTPEATNPLQSTAEKVVTSRMPPGIQKFSTPHDSPHMLRGPFGV